MGWSLRTLILTMILVGCGGGASDVLPIGFVNQTQHSVAELWTIWKSAQQSLARKVDLNPLQRSGPGALADLRPGDSRALHEAPHQIRVAAEPDVASGILFGMTGVLRTDPTGLIACRTPAMCVMRRLSPSMTSALPGMRNRGSSRATTSPLFWNMNLKIKY